MEKQVGGGGGGGNKRTDREHKWDSKAVSRNRDKLAVNVLERERMSVKPSDA